MDYSVEVCRICVKVSVDHGPRGSSSKGDTRMWVGDLVATKAIDLACWETGFCLLDTYERTYIHEGEDM